MFRDITENMVSLSRNYFGYFLNYNIISNKCKSVSGGFHLKSLIYDCSSIDNEG